MSPENSSRHRMTSAPISPSFLLWVTLSALLFVVRPAAPFLLVVDRVPQSSVRHPPERINEQWNARRRKASGPLAATSEPKHVETILFVECGACVRAVGIVEFGFLMHWFLC